MTTDKVLDTLTGIPWDTIALYGVPAVLVLIVVLAARKKADRTVSLIATGIGLAWSAQGMWDTAVHTYKVPEQLAAVLFLLFEAFMVSGMLRANRFRADLKRRGRHVRFVWTLGVVMGLVVAFGEGLEQAPLRLAVPLLVVLNWFIDLTADDDPDEALAASWRWTPRRLLLWLGALEPTKRDAKTIDRDRLRDRMTRLAFNIEHGSPRVNELFRRKVRLARMKTVADDANLAEVRARLARMSVILMEPAAVKDERPAPDPEPEPKRQHPARRQPDPVRLPQGVHTRIGRVLRGDELRDDAVSVMLKSATSDRPDGMTTVELMSLYDPPLKQRKADEFAALARKTLRSQRVNGSATSVSVP